MKVSYSPYNRTIRLCRVMSVSMLDGTVFDKLVGDFVCLLHPSDSGVRSTLAGMCERRQNHSAEYKYVLKLLLCGWDSLSRCSWLCLVTFSSYHLSLTTSTVSLSLPPSRLMPSHGTDAWVDLLFWAKSSDRKTMVGWLPLSFNLYLPVLILFVLCRICGHALWNEKRRIDTQVHCELFQAFQATGFWGWHWTKHAASLLYISSALCHSSSLIVTHWELKSKAVTTIVSKLSRLPLSHTTPWIAGAMIPKVLWLRRIRQKDHSTA